MANLVRAHAAAYQAIHDCSRTARVGIALHYRRFDPARPLVAARPAGGRPAEQPVQRRSSRGRLVDGIAALPVWQTSASRKPKARRIISA